jgi:WD40 repeat protein
VARRESLHRLKHEDGVNNLAFSPDGTRLVTASDDNSARVWDRASGAELCRLVHHGCVVSASFSPDGGRIMTRASFDVARVRAYNDPDSGGQYGPTFVSMYRVPEPSGDGPGEKKPSASGMP